MAKTYQQLEQALDMLEQAVDLRLSKLEDENDQLQKDLAALRKQNEELLSAHKLVNARLDSTIERLQALLKKAEQS